MKNKKECKHKNGFKYYTRHVGLESFDLKKCVDCGKRVRIDK